MLVRLYDLPDVRELLQQQREAGVDIRRALAPEKRIVSDWIYTHFGTYWASECEVAFSRQPVSCFVAIKDGELLGFACHDVTCKNFFGPTGVIEACRGRGIGKALLLVCLQAMQEQGYAYAIIGGVGPAEFYKKVVGAIDIEGSDPGIFKGLLPKEQ